MDNTFDRLFYERGNYIAGIDEAGVSDIAGPLISACVILPKIDLHKDNLRIFEINDSKKIPERFRKGYAELVWQNAYAIGIGEVSPVEIDYIGPHSATRLAMLRAVYACKKINTKKKIVPDFLMVDGNISLRTPIKQVGIPGGDSKSLSIAAASIVAKVYRDEIMVRLASEHPFYYWESNKGAPCEDHFKGIDVNGILPGIHRTRVWPFVVNPAEKDKLKMWILRRRKWKKSTERRYVEQLCPSITRNELEIALSSLESPESMLSL